MLNRVRLKTCVVLGRREARTVEDMSAALVDKEAGNLFKFLFSTHPSHRSIRSVGNYGTDLTPTPPP